MPIINMVYKKKKGWKPGANTLVYLPLDGDVVDQSGNSRDGTLPGSTYYSWEYINGNSGSKYIKTSSYSGTTAMVTGTYGTALGTGDRTISVWMKFVNISVATAQVCPFWLGSSGGGTQGEWFGMYCMDGSATQLGILRYYDDPYTKSFTYDTNWHNFVITYNYTNKAKMYCDGVQVTMTYNASSSFNTIGTGYQFGGGRVSLGDYTKQIGFSKFIVEDKARTATEVSNYYNQTKSNYGL